MGPAVSVGPDAPLVEWWIAGDKRWYFPSREPTVTQSLLSGTPVVETRMRLPGGEVIGRTYAIRRSSTDGGGDAIVIEIENASAGRTMLVLAKPARRAIARSATEGDVAAAIERGDATEAVFAPLHCPDGGAQGAVIVPVAHRTTMRAVVPVGGSVSEEPAVTYPSAMPASSQVADGWRVQTRDLARVTVPDPRVGALLEIAAPTLLSAPLAMLADGGASTRSPDGSPRWDHVAAIAGALGELGLREAAEVFLARAAAAADVENPGAATDPGLSWLVVACGEHLLRFPDRDLAEALADTALHVASRRPARRHRSHTTPSDTHPVPGGHAAVLRAASVVLEVAGHDRAAGDAHKMADTADDGSHGTPSGIATDVVQRALWARHGARLGQGTPAWRTFDTLLDVGSPTLAWPATLSTNLDEAHHTDRHCVASTAALASLALALLAHVDESRLRILSALPATWLGQKIEVHGVATPVGVASFALRWHGNRPALLWEIDDTGRLTAEDVDATALDPTWHSHEHQGEALLEPVERLEPERAKKSGVTITGLQIGRAPTAERE